MTSFSPNMLKTFKECPQKYYFKYIRHISAPQKAVLFEKGKKIHALANYYLCGDDITRLEKVLTKEEQAVWERLKDNEYFKKTCVATEYSLTCKINGYWIGGRLDALVKDGNNYYILDYKTGAIPQNPEFDFQTMVYLLAASKFIKDCQSLTFIYIDLKNNSNYKIDLTPELKSKYETVITTVCDEMHTTYAFTGNSKSCKYCEYNKFC